ncbi:MAG: UDP-N-acetylglucosamine 2-epimerase (non-hydrolyzing) [Bacteroidetes bacterium]|nr:UDP-N-acetylglucosamine 2-epimerase (non-hydrolyzing) [Bacteroidota bacterium]
MKILTVVGARPQFIKAAAVSRAITQHSDITEVIVHTGQHFDEKMSDIFFREMAIPKPDYNLDINSLSHGAMTGRMLEGIEQILIMENPDYLLVYGDTNSTVAGALAASKLHIKVIHVEAGLRSFNMKMPEEVNRIITDRISDILFCPTEEAVKNLRNEGFENFSSQIVHSGDVMEDAALFYAQLLDNDDSFLQNMGVKSDEYALVTLHRQENTDSVDKLTTLVSTLNQIAKEKPIVLPLHPRTRKKLNQLNLELKVNTIEPVGYFDMIRLIRNSSFVMTDSGGLQKEAYFFNKFCITLREQTEWVELQKDGYNFVVGTSKEKCIDAVMQIEKREFERKSELYGGGHAAQFIVNYLKKKL